MNNLKKLGLTALAGSLAAVSANAGEMSVSGSFNATYVTVDGNTGTPASDHGIGLGNDKDVTFSGSGELDNGWTFSGYTLMKESDGFNISSSALSMTMGSMGTIGTASGSGGSSTKYDQQTPTAYEEFDDAASETLSANVVGNKLDNNSLIYNSPSYDLGGMSASFDIEYTPEATGTSPNDGGSQHAADVGNGRSLGVTLKGAGLTFGIYGSEVEYDGANANIDDAFEGVWYANYTMGPVSVGYSQSYLDRGLNTTTATAATTGKTIGTAGGIFEATQMSIAFKVNDDFSVSYGKADDTYDAQSNASSGTEIADVDVEHKHIAAAYSMGAMSIKAYRSEATNINYDSNGATRTKTEIALGLAF
jgi:outer membrane protein OmpU